MKTIESAWQRISVWYDANTPAGTLILAPGATSEEISRLENEIGFALPDDLRASLALHNGSLNGGFLLNYGELLSVEQILYWHRTFWQWQTDEQWGLAEGGYDVEYAEDSIKHIWWNPLRLPLTDNSGDAAMADFDPS